MNKSQPGNSGTTPARRSWVRRVHRWFGLAALLFVLLLSATGIALNHTSAWRLDERYLRWPWLLDAYGIEAPTPSASFADGNHRATQLGRRLYLDGRDLARDIDELAGTVVTGDFVVVATDQDVFVLTTSGELVERMSLAADLPAGIGAIGRAAGRVAVHSGVSLFRFDEHLVNLEPWTGNAVANPQWSIPSPPAADELSAIQDLYRGRGVTVERLLADLHSGRIITRFGPLLMDAVAVLLILLSLSGLWMWMQRSGNGNRHNGSRC
ncbi:MAG: PepSY domain-containing protein [Woeseiaceae bacterium]